MLRIDSTGTGSVVLTVAGEVDLSTAGALTDAVNTAVQSPDAQTVRVDLSEVSFMDSTGLSALVSGRKLADQHGVRLEIANPQPHLLKVIRITGLAEVLGLPQG
jgi:anti-anti-sigma factor